MTSSEEVPSHDEALEELVFETLERLERAGSSELESVIASAEASRPDLAPFLRRRISALRQVGLVASDEPVYVDIPRRFGAFDVRGPIGEGGMGVVVEAYDSALDRPIALKLIRPEFIDQPTIRQRFHREVDAVAQIQHPGIVRVFDVGEESGLPYLAMEKVDGSTLGAVIDALRDRDPGTLRGRDLFDVLSGDRPGPCPPLFDGPWHVVCARVIRDVAEAVSHAHAAGVQHRDIKASNIMVTPLGRVVLLDFGLAQVAGSAALTRTGALLGSLPYKAPESIRGAARDDEGAVRRAGELSDVYSLGVVLYELLTLRLPFREASSAELVEAILDKAPVSVRAVNPSAPPPLAQTVERATRRDPHRRIPSAAALASSLSSVLEGRTPRPHGDGLLAALGSRWRARPFTTSALTASVLIAAFLPLMWLRYEAREAASTARSSERSLGSLGAVLSATDEMVRLLPRSLEARGTQLDELRLRLSNELVGVRTAVASDSRLDAHAGDLRRNALAGRAALLVELGRLDEARQALRDVFAAPELSDAVLSRATVTKAQLAASEADARAMLLAAAERVTDPWPRARLVATLGSLTHAAREEREAAVRALRSSVRDGVASSPDLALIRAAHLELKSGDATLGALQDAIRELKGRELASPYPLEIGLMLARLEAESGRLHGLAGGADEALAFHGAAVSRLTSLSAALPGSVGLRAELARLTADESAGEAR